MSNNKEFNLGSGIRDQGSGIRDQGSGIRDQGSGIRDQGSGIRDQGSGIRDQGSGIRDQGSGIRDQGSGITILYRDHYTIQGLLNYKARSCRKYPRYQQCFPRSIPRSVLASRRRSLHLPQHFPPFLRG